MEIRRLTPDHAAVYRTLMLEALETDPEAFTATRAEHGAQPLAWWQSRVSDVPGAPEDVYGGFVDGTLVGLAGIRFHQRARTRHKSTLFGMFVRPAHRTRGIGRALAEAVLDRARSDPDTQLVQLTVVADNGAARRLYESCGFRVFGIEPYANRVDNRFVALAHMWCPLAPELSNPEA